MRALVPVVSLVLVACGPDDPGGNEVPTARIDEPADGAVVRAEAAVILRGTVADADHGVADLSVTWRAGDVVLCEAAPSADGVTTCEASFEGTTEVVLQARDPDGGVGADAITVEVAENAPPTARILTPAEGSDAHYSDVPVRFTAVVGDDLDDPAALTVAWSEGAGALDITGDPTTDGALEGAILLEAGAHTITLTVTDSEGGVTRADVSFTVGGPNATPTCAITAPADGSVVSDGVMTALQGALTDEDHVDDPLTWTWSSDRDGVLATGSDDPAASAGLSPGAHTLSLAAADAAGATCEATVEVTVSARPTVTIDAPTSGAVLPGGANVAFAATVADDDTAPDALALRWESDLDGLLDATPADASGAAGFAARLSRGTHTVTLTATDAHGLDAWADVVVVVENGAPGAPVVAITPAIPGTEDDLVVQITTPSADPEGDQVTYTYVWTVDGVVTAHTSASVPHPATGRGEVWSVTVTPHDDQAAGQAGVASVTIADTPPVATSVTLTPTSAFEGSTLSCAAAGTDVDGDAITWIYGWTVDGAEVLPSPGASLTGASFGKGDVVTCTARPTANGLTGAERASAPVTILNSPPGTPGVAVTPERPAIGEDDLTCGVTIDAPDGDGDDVTHHVAWTVDGQPYPGAFPEAVGPVTSTLLGDTVPTGDLALGFDWTCTVTARDDEADGGSASAGTRRAVCDGATIDIANLPGWGSGGYAISQLVWTELESEALNYGDCLLSFTDLRPSFEGQLASYDLAILLNPAGGNAIYSASQESELRAFAADGGGLLGTGYFLLRFNEDTKDNSALIDLFGVEPSTLLSSFGATSRSSGTVVGAHPITRNLPSTFDKLIYAGDEQGNAGGWSEDDLLPGARFVLRGADESSVIAYEGEGRAVYFTGLAGFAPISTEAKQLLYDALVWAAGYR